VTTSLNSVGAITLFVEDPQRSKSFYEDVFGALVIFEDEDPRKRSSSRTRSSTC
jgi:catechol 2,3-dioxygenase-like lactoylglutathione lyase family enzyme